ncbi:MAG: prolyl oligopeptidase family serine peptidase [Asticcacaulis sp.]|nr:prolyl oligopeptidase family serine peptidase [Asticcacaulis sp.]
MLPPAPGVDGMLNMRALYHVMGTAADADTTLVTAGSNATFPLAAQEFPAVAFSPQSDWALAYAGGARAEFRVCLVRKAELGSADARFNCLVGYDDGVQGAIVHGDALYLLSKKTTPNGELLKIDLTAPNPSLADAKVVVAQSADDVITGINVARDGLYVRTMTAGIDHFTRLPHDGSAPVQLPLPFEGAAYLTDSDPAADGLVFTLQTWTKPRQLLAYDPAAKTISDLHLGANSPKDYDSAIDIVTTEIASTDGAMVPLTLLVPKGMKPDGKALTLLDAYGAYGTTTQPFFDPMTLEWVMKGHIYALVSIRGGGEKGDAWRLAGKGLNKHHGIEDLTAAADYVVAKGYSTTPHVAIYGASAGGIIMGGSVAHYPTHFGAAIIHAGMLNPSRLAAQGNGANQYSEFGDATTADGFDSLLKMDAYQAVTPGQAYPPVLIDVGLNDNRVAPWNSGKFGAAVAAAGGQVIYRTDLDSGHFGTSLSQAAAEKADHYTFLEKVMGADK